MLKKGYLLTITTSENDYDNLSTKEFSGLNFEETRFYIQIAKLFEEFGNSNMHASEHITAAFVNVCSKLDYWPEDFDPEFAYDYVMDFCYDLVGKWNDYENWRVFESFDVHYISETIPSAKDSFECAF